MNQPEIMQIPVQPYFELEDFMNFAHETRISTAALESFASLWDIWQEKLLALRIKSGSDSWLAIWLPEEVEQSIDAAWQKSPGEGLLLNNLAQYMCMSALGQLMPQVEELGCAPVPARNAVLSAILVDKGLASASDTQLSRRFAVLTHYPFRGGCEACALSANCPKLRGGDFEQVILPGHERGCED